MPHWVMISPKNYACLMGSALHCRQQTRRHFDRGRHGTECAALLEVLCPAPAPLQGTLALLWSEHEKKCQDRFALCAGQACQSVVLLEFAGVCFRPWEPLLHRALWAACIQRAASLGNGCHAEVTQQHVTSLKALEASCPEDSAWDGIIVAGGAAVGALPEIGERTLGLLDVLWQMSMS